MEFWKNTQFVRKVQAGFLVITVIATIIVINDLYQMYSTGKVQQKLENEVRAPKETLNQIISEYHSLQFNLLRFSIKEFEASFQTYILEVRSQKAKIDTLFSSLAQSTAANDSMTQDINKLQAIWKNYKNVVADAIMSAGMSKDFEMAAIVSTSSGEEVGTVLSKQINKVQMQLDAKEAELKDKVESSNRFTRYLIIFIMIIGTAASGFAILWLAPEIAKPLTVFEEVVEKFALGDYNTKLNTESTDEFGRLARQLESLKQAQLQKIEAARKIAAGVFEKVTPASDRDELGFSFNQEVETFNELFVETNTLIEANQQGKLKHRGDISKFSGSWRTYIEGINSILESVIKPIQEAEKVLQKMAHGDLREQMVGNYAGDYEIIKGNVNTLLDSLNQALRHVQDSSNELSGAAAEISASTEQMAASVSEQSAQTSEIAAAIEEMTKTITENAENAKIASHDAKITGNKAKQSGETVLNTITGINRLAEVIVRSSNTIQGLGKSSDQIGEIIQVIEDIADQTNLLALNAAIEAARAGEQGRGFAVVADEVRKLAERTSKATKEIGTMIRTIQHDTAEAVQVIKEGTAEVEKNRAFARSADEALQEIIRITSDNSNRMEILAQANESQVETSELISKNIDQINNVSQQTAQTIQQISISAENLYRLTNSMQEMLQHFQLDSDKQQKSGSQKQLRNTLFLKN
ncbi:MAG: methyl-accepting chemotaxis protein [Ignavibacteria bacterium]|nr:methyl-accepting chemotaxis protein [Ignavibacteria bacterium]